MKKKKEEELRKKRELELKSIMESKNKNYKKEFS